tara:strand:+ start:36 stop:1049 length:1014 start_codon:yes stop_codon:yes gene_type:complete
MINRSIDFRIPNRGMDFSIPNRGMDFSIPNIGIGSVLDMRRDANMTRNNARDQYEADVADFKDSLATDLENNFMSRGDSFLDTPVVTEFPTDMINIPPPRFIEDRDMIRDELSIGIDPPQNIYENVINQPEQIQVPPPRFIREDFVFDNPVIDINLPITPPRELDDTIIPPTRPDRFSPDRIFDGPDRQDVIDYFDNIQGPDIPDDTIIDDTIVDNVIITTPPPPPDNRRPFYQPSRNYESGVPSIATNISPAAFGMAPGMFPPGPPRPIVKLPRIPITPPPNRPDGRGFSIQRLDDDLTGLRFGGALNKGIMRLPQSQQGDTMTTQIFQKGFRPRR